MTTTHNFNCDQNDILALFAATRFAHQGMTVEQFTAQTQKDYAAYVARGNAKYTYSEWINRQVVVLTSGW
jgi:hypothetical protein